MIKINEMKKEISGPVLHLNDFDLRKTALVVVDMVNGFVRMGALASPRVEEMVPNIVKLNERLIDSRKVYFVDEHEKGCSEFKSYPPHCIKGTVESEIIDELLLYTQDNKLSTIISKNSTNGFLAPGFKEWLNENKEIETFIVVGCITDVCVMQFVLSLKAYFNQNNLERDIVVPSDCVDTFDAGTHDAELINIFTLYNLKSNGIVIVDSII